MLKQTYAVRIAVGSQQSTVNRSVGSQRDSTETIARDFEKKSRSMILPSCGSI